MYLPKSRVWRYVFFFFQAEDGIRDYKVTGVQTCALPISAERCREEHATRNGEAAEHAALLLFFRRRPTRPGRSLRARRACRACGLRGLDEIGRASCRERV